MNQCLVRKFLLAIVIPAAIACTATQAFAQESEAQTSRAPLQVDFLGAEFIPGLDGIAVAGLYGMVGLLKADGDAWRLERFEGGPPEDYTSVAKLNDNEALVGSSSGKIFIFDGKSLTQVGQLSDYSEPVLDIVAHDGKAWAVGGRGMVAKSTNGREWEILEIRDITQPIITFEKTHPADWYFGVSNVDLDSVKLTATVGGEPAVEDEHYLMFADEGFLQITTEFDSAPAPTIEFIFNPGPAFRAGDVSWNAVLYDGSKITLAGEFGMVIQSEDDGETWIRRDTRLVEGEPSPPYWLAGAQSGETIRLAGAAGVSAMSTDGGLTWTDQPRPGNEGIFGITMLDDGSPLIAGAVGLIGRGDGANWDLADRTQLRLLSWLKNPVPLSDGSILMLGGRSTAINYKDGEWVRKAIIAQ